MKLEIWTEEYTRAIAYLCRDIKYNDAGNEEIIRDVIHHIFELDPIEFQQDIDIHLVSME